MNLTLIDFLVIAGYFALAVGIASLFIRRAKRSIPSRRPRLVPGTCW